MSDVDTSFSSFILGIESQGKDPHCDHMSQCRGIFTRDQMQQQPFVGQNRLFAEPLFRVSNVARNVNAAARAGAARVKACVRVRIQ